MALILGVHQGSKFYLNDVPVAVLATEGYKHVDLEVQGKKFKISDDRSVEIYPRVFVSSGVPVNQMGRGQGTMKGLPDEILPRLVIEAPRSVVILREELWKKGRKPS